tara:strand:+ start:5782 stop:6282 length:501 start_codon:yes stop_codon:yes gene_type:complete
MTPTSHHIDSNCKIINFPIELRYSTENKTRTAGYNYSARGKNKTYSTDEVRLAWGAPDEITSDEHHTIWTYREKTLRWSGMVLHALVTIPLAIPTGKTKYTLYFNNDNLEKILHHTFSTKLFVCDPLYMMTGVMAAGMSPTGQDSSIGLCNVIDRKGMYFHYLMNY